MERHRHDASGSVEAGEMDDVPPVLRGMAHVFVHVGALLLQLAAAGIVINAVYRYTLGGGFPLITETTRFVLMVVVFLGLAGTHLAGGHVQVELLKTRAGPRLSRAMNGFLVPVVSLFFLALIFYAGWTSTMSMFQYGTTAPSRPAVLLWPFMAVVPLGAGLLMLVLVTGLTRRLFGRGAQDPGTSE